MRNRIGVSACWKLHNLRLSSVNKFPSLSMSRIGGMFAGLTAPFLDQPGCDVDSDHNHVDTGRQRDIWRVTGDISDLQATNFTQRFYILTVP